MRIDTVDRYRFGVSEADMTDGVCIVQTKEIEAGLPEGATAAEFGSIAVVHSADRE